MSQILIVGTGALATLFAARLVAAGHSVCMLGTWQAGLRALQNEGARLVDATGRQHSFPVQASDDPARVRGIRTALVLVKTWQTADAAHKLSECLAGDGLAISLQNGIGNREQLAECLGGQRVAVGATTTGATLLGPGLVRSGGEGIVSLERLSSAALIQSALKSAGFTVRTVRDARSLLWGKLVINAAINPLTALLRITNGELIKRPAAHDMMAGLAQEVAAVAGSEGIHLPFVNPVRATEEVARRTAENRSSMFQDILRGTPTEIDAICGAVTQQGAKHGVPTPLNYACWRLIRALTGG